MITASRPHEDYVRYRNGRRVWWKAVLEEGGPGFPLRVSRKQFDRARVAGRYRRRVLARLTRLRACALSEQVSGGDDVFV